MFFQVSGVFFGNPAEKLAGLRSGTFFRPKEDPGMLTITVAAFVAGAAHCALEVQISSHAQHFVNLEVQISWPVQRFVNIEVRITWQGRHCLKLEVQIS